MTALHPSRRGVVAGVLTTGLLPGRALAVGRHGIAASEPRVEWLAEPIGIDAPRPRFGWAIAAADAQARGLRQSAWRIVVARSAAEAAAGGGDVWDSGRQDGGRPAAQPPRDLPLRTQTPYWWSIMLWDGEGQASGWSAPARFVTGVLSGWQGRWIAAERGWPVQIAESRKGAKVASPTPMPIFRQDFTVDRPVAYATLSLCGLGHHAASINGQAAATSMLDSGWTDYRRTVLYTSHDVATLLRPGANALGVMLGNGMYHVDGGTDRYKKFGGTFGQPRLIAQLTIGFTDGTQQVIGSGPDWQTRPGPIVFSSIYGGEDHDARLEVAGWDGPGASPDGWRSVLAVDGPAGTLKAQGFPPIRVSATFPAVAITEPKPGVFVYDFGENASVRPALVVRGPAGATVRMSPAELLAPDGTIAPRSIGARPNLPVHYCYTLAGRGEETWRPRFTYCGSRYLQVEGAAPSERGQGGATVVSLANEFVHTDLAPAGRFTCDQPLLVKVHDLIARAVWSNSVSVFTDCPHREKLGWLEQDHLNAETVLSVEDGITLYEKTIADIVDAQLPNGQVPEIAPEFVQFLGPDAEFRDSPEWGGAVVIAAWKTYRAYGDRRILDIGYPAMLRYADHIERQRVDGLVTYGLNDWLDLAPRVAGSRTHLTSQGLTATATYYQMVTCLVDIAVALGRSPAEVAGLRKRAAGVRAAFNRAWFRDDTGRYDTGSQTANAMPLALGMVPAGQEERVLASLVAAVRARDDHVTAGDIGFHYVVRALSEYGRGDVLHAMLSRTDAPSYGAQVMAGATALTENWDPAAGGSQNHFMLGHGLAWFYNGLGGITLDFWQRQGPVLTIAPQTVQGVSRVDVSYRSALGPVRSAWSRQAGGMRFEVEVPAGADALLRFPVPLARLREGSGRAAGAAGVRAASTDSAGSRLLVGSGRYRFATI